MSSDDQRLLSVVVIGLNEQDRLKDSLEAIFANRPAGRELEVIYVDSGSTDRSVEIAKGVPAVQVLQLGPGPRSAARARNMGLRHARGSCVQLVDGDSVIQPGWLDAALAMLERRPDAACVFGQCIEMYPDQSIYMKLCGLDWHIPAGDYRLCGGNAMWRTAVIAEHGFFDETLKAGEEPDLCYRVRHQGGKIVCVDAPMVTHDLGMRRFSQYWKRAEGSGKGYAKVASRYWRNNEKLWLREVLLNFAEPLVWLVVFAVGWLWNGFPGGLALLLGWWGTRTLQIAYAMRSRRLDLPHALMYGLHCQFVRLPVAIGQLKSLLGWR
jgi:GT2 family glycosyltransferase